MATSKRQVLIRVQPEDYKKLKAISIKNHRSVSNLLEWLMLNFINDYELYAMTLCEELRCFDPDCSLQINSWQCDNLSYIVCSCGYVLDSTNRNHIVFYKKDSLSTFK